MGRHFGLKQQSTVPTCSICCGPLYRGDPDWKGGNNAQPVNGGRCCDECNARVVLPARATMSGTEHDNQGS